MESLVLASLSRVGRIVEWIRAVRRPVDPSEMQQANIRLFISACLTPYFMWYRFVNQGHIPTDVFVLLVLFISYSLFVVGSLHVDFLGAKLRRDVFFLIDTVFICYTMYVGDRVVAPMVLTLYWQTLGYSTRYGERYMKYGIVLSGTGFFIVINTTPYWQENWELGYGLLFGATVIPAFFVGNMLKKMKEAQQRTEEARKKAEEASATKSRFLSTMSHELRTPLNGILGATDLCTGLEVSDEHRGFLTIIHSSATHLLSLVNDVLDISKIEEGRVVIETEILDLHSFLKNSVTIVSQQAIRKGLAFRMNVSPKVPALVKADSTRLRQVLTNLLSNAVKFTSAGEIAVRVLLESEDERSARIRFEVSDTGIGMAPEQQAKVFDRFVQADNAITRKYGGTGLGTAISKELVELMGGEIRVQSLAGKGSTFWFCVPLEKAIERRQTLRMCDRTEVVVLSRDDSATETLVNHLHSAGIHRIQRTRSFAWAEGYIEKITSARSIHHIVVVVQHALGHEALRFSDRLAERDLRRNVRMILVGGVDSEAASRHGYRSTVASAYEREDFLRAIHFVQPCEETVDDCVFDNKGKRLRILIAEDNEVNQIVIRKLLERAGHEVLLVDDGNKALNAMTAQRFDVALLDLNMPVMSGMEAARRYLALNREHPIPMVALTADATVESRRKCLDAGMQAYLTKPFETKRVLALLQSFNGSTEPGERLATAPEDFDGSQFDDSKVRELEEMGSSPDFIRNIVWVFVRDSDKRAQEMERALAGQDSVAFRDAAHSLKGIAGAMGALRVMDMAAAAQQLGDDAPVEDRERLLAGIRKEVGRVRKTLMKRYSIVDPSETGKPAVSAPTDSARRPARP